MNSHDSSPFGKEVEELMKWDSNHRNNSWILVDLPPGSKAIKSKWIFKRKLRVDINIEKFKARLVDKGFTQREELDYFDTYASVARTTTIRILIALASINKLIIHQMDVKTAFLNGESEEEVYMEQPEDDMFIFGTDLEQVQMTKKLLSENFDMKVLGESDVILGIKILPKENRPMLALSHYIEKILKHFDSFNSLPVSTPSEVGKPYPLSPTTLQPAPETMDYGLEYNEDPSVLEGYTDASWITNQQDYASTSGWIFTLAGGAVSWGSKKQSCLTDSTMAAEFVAMASCCKEEEYLRDLLINIPLWPKPMPPISVHYDSQSTLSRAYNQVYNGKSRYIGLRHRQVNQLINDGVITVSFLRSSKNLAYPFTKGLPRQLIESTSQGMGLKPMYN
ncbi:retrovirus-related pol polyprotein from transposon TNT 1-94 [Tanacetum coccineum]